jgi:hypothetical protein
MLGEPHCSIRRCRHFTGVSQPDGTEMTERVVCSAFPKGIPDDIAYGANKHTTVDRRQSNKIVYEPE